MSEQEAMEQAWVDGPQDYMTQGYAFWAGWNAHREWAAARVPSPEAAAPVSLPDERKD